MRRPTGTLNQTLAPLPRAAKLDGDNDLTRYNHSESPGLKMPRKSNFSLPPQETRIKRVHRKWRANSNYIQETSLHDDKMNTSGMDLIQDRSVHSQRATIIGTGIRTRMKSISQGNSENRDESLPSRINSIQVSK